MKGRTNTRKSGRLVEARRHLAMADRFRNMANDTSHERDHAYLESKALEHQTEAERLGGLR